MKTLSQTLLFSFLITQICFAQWYQQKSGTTESLYSIQFINDTVGWVAGGDGAFGGGGIILKTSNGGITWDQQTTGILYSLYDIYMINENIGYAVGEAGVIINTTDGGSTWTQQQQPFGTNSNLNSVYFLNENLGWTVGVGDSTVILKTTDGGLNWIAQTADTNLSYFPLRDVFIINENIGWIVGGNFDSINPEGILLKTTNGGATWTKIYYGGRGAISAIQFLNENTGWFAGYFKDSFIWGTHIYVTTNGGDNWTMSPFVITSVTGLSTIHFINKDLGWAVDGHYGGLYGGFIFKTTDGGWSWVGYSSGTTDIGLRSIFFIDSTCGWVVGDMGTILHTTNGGVSFVEEEEIEEIPTEYLLSQNFPNPFNSSSIIKYSIPKSSQVTIKTFNTLGQEIETLVNEEKPVGTYELNWNAANLPSGVYFYRLQAGDFLQTRKMILLK